METSSVFQSRRKPIKMPRIEHTVLVRSSVWPMRHVKTRLYVAADTKNHDEILISSTLGHTLSLQSHQTVNLMSMFAGGCSCLNEAGVWTTDLLMLFVYAVAPPPWLKLPDWGMVPRAGDKNGLLQHLFSRQGELSTEIRILQTRCHCFLCKWAEL